MKKKLLNLLSNIDYLFFGMFIVLVTIIFTKIFIG